MSKINTKEDVYNNLKFFVFNNWSLKDNFGEMPELRKFVDQLFDFNYKSVLPFNEETTANIRVLYSIGDWQKIISDYYEEGIDLLNNNFNLIQCAAILHDFILYPERFLKKKTRV